MTDPNSPHCRLEQGTALGHVWDAADAVRAAIPSLTAATEEHARSVFAFVRAVADGQSPDPAELLRTRGQVQAALAQIATLSDDEAANLSELRFGLLPAEDDPLEARAMDHLRARFQTGAASS